MRDAQCAHRCVSVIFDLFVLPMCLPVPDIDMPGNTGTGDYWNPPDGEACCGGTY